MSVVAVVSHGVRYCCCCIMWCFVNCFTGSGNTSFKWGITDMVDQICCVVYLENKQGYIEKKKSSEHNF